jgi:hypothetical protein
MSDITVKPTLFQSSQKPTKMETKLSELEDVATEAIRTTQLRLKNMTHGL